MATKEYREASPVQVELERAELAKNLKTTTEAIAQFATINPTNVASPTGIQDPAATKTVGKDGRTREEALTLAFQLLKTVSANLNNALGYVASKAAAATTRLFK